MIIHYLFRVDNATNPRTELPIHSLEFIAPLDKATRIDIAQRIFPAAVIDGKSLEELDYELEHAYKLDTIYPLHVRFESKKEIGFYNAILGTATLIAADKEWNIPSCELSFWKSSVSIKEVVTNEDIDKILERKEEIIAENGGVARGNENTRGVYISKDYEQACEEFFQDNPLVFEFLIYPQRVV